MKTYKNSLIAWEKLNEAFLRSDPWLHGEEVGGCVYAYNRTIKIRDPQLDPQFDFGRHFNYTDRKWQMLVANYIDKESIERIREEVEAAESDSDARKRMSIVYQFESSHKNSKSCLLTMILSNRASRGGRYRNMTVVLRASEVTKRLIVDLLLFQRIGEYVWPSQKWTLTVHFDQIFNDDKVLLMYHAHRDIRKILSAPGVDPARREKILKKLGQLLDDTVEAQRYKIYKRVITVLKPEKYKTPVTLARDCKLFINKLKSK